MNELDKSQDDLIVDLSYGRKTIFGNKLDFSSLNVSRPLAHGLKCALEATLGGCSHETKKIAWRHIRLFCSYLVVSGLSKTNPLPSTILVTFSQWLVSETSNSQNYKAVIVNQIVSLISWCYRNTNELIHSDLRLDLPRLHAKKIKSSASNLNEDEIKKILSAAYKDIDLVINRIRKFRELQYDPTNTLEELKIHKVLMEIGERGLGLFISGKELSKDNSFKRRVEAAGGLDKLSRYLYPSSEDIFPFYLAILCQCSGNPMSMRVLTKDNIQDHPLRSDRQRIVWSKSRSGYEQKADFSSQRSRSAPNLVKLLCELNNPLVPFATNQDKKMVFLAYRRGIVSVPCWQMFHKLLEKFITYHELSDFNFKDLRRAGASLHQKASGSILAATKRLNHRTSHTTLRYVTEEVMQELNNEMIAESQTLLHANVLNVPIKDHIGIHDKEIIPADTLFGFKCKNPFAGIAPSTLPGSLCIKFTGCATCPGSIIPLDDPVVISRLLKTLEQLRLTKIRAIEQGWIERYLSIYEPTQKILEETIIPKVTSSVKAKAQLLMAGHSIPYLE